MGEAVFPENPLRGGKNVLANQNPPGQNAERAFGSAHVIVEDEMRNSRIFKQGTDEGYQNQVIGTQHFFQPHLL